MTEKLTLEIAMKYPNAKMKTVSNRGTVAYNNIWDFFDNYLQGSLEDTLGIVDWDDCKLILRSKESLTDEEKDNLSYEAGGDFEPMVFNYYKLYPSEIIAVDYLRSINIDIDNLKSKGIAVYE